MKKFDMNYIRFLSGVISEAAYMGDGVASPAEKFNLTNPMVGGMKIDPKKMHMDFYNWLKVQDKNDYDLAQLFDGLAHTKIMDKFLDEYKVPQNWAGGQFKATKGMGKQQYIS